MYVIYDEDLIIAKVQTNNYENIVELPESMEDLQLDQMRFDGEKLIDVSNLNEFYIDENGEKHIQQDPSNTRQLLTCKWYDILEKDNNGNWKVITLDKLKMEKMREVYEYRKQKENEGIYIDNFYVDTSETGRLNLSNTINAYEWGLMDKTQTIQWKINTGEFREVTYDQLKIFAGYVAKYVEDLFKAEQLNDYLIRNLDNEEDILNFDITQNFPSNNFTLGSS